jgi:filamentous hemagglutinin family protein
MPRNDLNSAAAPKGARKLATCIALILGSARAAHSTELPVPCVAGSCGASAAKWVGAGTATAVQTANTLTITQTSSSAILNWKSFNISSDGTVTFKQPGAASVALNEIFQADPSKILGALNSNGAIYLINQNGIIFGAGAQVNVGTLVASSLNITPQALNGILGAAQQFAPAFTNFTDAQGNSLPSGPVSVESGATLQAPGGEVMLFAPQVQNAGTIRANGGQVILAAGDQIYLAASTDPNLRGLVVQVGGSEGTATNAAASGSAPGGQIAANLGDVTMVGLIVNQLGRVSATTSVQENGSIHLLAQGGGGVQSVSPSGAQLFAGTGGSLTLGAGSHTDVLLDTTDTSTAVDATAQPRSQVVLNGTQVLLASGSEVTATAGDVNIVAAANPTLSSQDYQLQSGTGRLVIDSGATIDVSGANIQEPVSDNVIAAQLRGTELADSPLQRNGPLRGQTVYVDLRQTGTRADGTTWIGSPIGDLSGYAATVQRTVAERSLTGGSISLQTDGAALIYSGANLNISGGSIQYLPGMVDTTKLLGTNGIVYDISQADPNQTYVGIVNSDTVSNNKWGTSTTYSTAYSGTYEAGYLQGYDAGSVSIAAPVLALDGSIIASTVTGPLQRQLPTAVAAGALYRPVDEIPLGGQLILGLAQSSPSAGYLAQNVTFASGSVLDTLTGPQGAAFDPLVDPLPASLNVTQLRPDLFGAGGISQLEIFANGSVTVPQGVNLQLPIAGSVAITAGAVDIEGRIGAPSGSIAVDAAPTLTMIAGSPDASLALGSSAVLDVRGYLVNDLPVGATAARTDPLAINGGSIQLSAAGGTSLELESGSIIDVSAGAQLTSAGKINPGSAGNISLTVGTDANADPIAVTLDSTFRGFALQNGGGISITANSICISVANCSSGVGSVWIAPSLFDDDGFARVSLTSNLGGLTLQDTSLDPRQLNYQFAAYPASLPTGTLLDNAASIVLLPDLLRNPENVSLAVSVASFAPTTTPSITSANILDVGPGSEISLDPKGVLSLASNTSIVLDGALSAPGGNISLTTTTTLPVIAFLPNQGIWLDDGSLISTRGVALTQVNDQGLTTGSVLGGGSISITANRGYLITAPGSMIDASGTAATLDLTPAIPSGESAPVPTLVGSAGGTVNLTASEGMLLNGSAVARAGAVPGVSGGTLNIDFDGTLHNDPSGGQPIFPENPHQMDVADFAPIIVAPGYAVPDQFNGVAMVSTQLINGGGFSNVTLSVPNVYGPAAANVGVVAYGSIYFSHDANLNVAGSLRLDTPQILGGAGAQVSLTAAYVGLGSDDTRLGSQVGGSATPGTGTLQVNADLVDLIGTLGLSGFQSTTVSSSGDIRLIGIQTASDQAQPLAETLNAQGSLTLQADQIYPTTLTQASIVVGGATSQLDILPGGAGGPVLSAGGELSMQANTIVQAGTLNAPFGQINLNAQQLTLAPGSVTSTSGAGQTIPFGTTQAGTDWVYVLPQGQTVLYTASGPPAKSVSLQANSINVAAGATVDIRGGGDMQAYEFIPGTGGTVDVLANSFSPTQFAILPMSSLAFAPYDPQASSGFNYAIGSSVVLGAGSGVPPGTYAILPARYALLPGAYLVTPTSGYANIAPGQSVTQSDGSVVVAGRFIQAGSGLGPQQTQGFDVASQAQVLSEAQYNLTSANTFFGALATANNTAAPPLPRDAGSLQLLAGQQLQFLGTLADSAASGGHGGLVDISAAQIEITDGSASGTQGVVSLDAAQLNGLNAQSLLIGGVRSTQGSNESVTQIQTTASSISIDPNVRLTGSDLILTASNSISLAPGAELSATGGTAVVSPSEYDLTGGGALLRVSTGPQTSIVRSNLDGADGVMNLAANSVLQASGSATLDATGTLISEATYDLHGAALAFLSPQISLGSGGNAGGLVLSSAALSSLGLADLALTSTAPITIYGANTLAINGTLSLNSPGIEAASTDASATLSAHSIDLLGTGAAATPAPALSGAAFSVQANTVALGGNESVLGFASDTIAAQAAIVAQSSGSLNVDAPLTMQTALLTGARGVSFQILSPAALQVLGDGGAAAAPVNAATSPGASPGANLSLTGSSIFINTDIASPSGTLQLSATGPNATDGVTLGSAATVNMAGNSTTFDGMTAAGPGGSLLVSSLQGGFTEAAGAAIMLSAGSPAAAGGELNIWVPQSTATLLGTLSANGSSGGDFSLVALQLPNLGSLNAALNTGGFAGARSFRQIGAGDVIVPVLTDGSVHASSVSIEADGGSVDIQGTIDASGASGGQVTLSAQNAVDVEGSILADATQAGNRGGSILLSAKGGIVNLANSALIDLSGAAGGQGGTLSLQVPRASLNGMLTGGEGITLGGTYRGVQGVQVQGLATYLQASGVISAQDTAADPSNPLYADAVTFMQNAAAIGQTVAGHSNLDVSVVPGIEIDSTGDLTLASAWDLSSWRFGADNVPGVLTLRAAGNLVFQQSLSDGFIGTSGASAFVLPSTLGASWSYRLVGGADLTASNAMTVQAAGSSGSIAGSVIIAPGTVDGGAANRVADPIMIRTGTGSIDIAAAGDLEFGNRASTIYTAGEASAVGIPLAGLQDLAYPTNGGDVRIEVGGDILGAPTNQLVTSWLWRTGQDASSLRPSATGWTVNYQWFEENVGALGGGNVSISAGGDVSELSVALPNIGIQVGGTTAASNSVLVTGGGALTVSSGGDITGGSYYIGSGSGDLFARGSIGADTSGRATATGNAPILALGDASLTVSAIDSAAIESALNPMLLPLARIQPTTTGSGSFFSTYTDNSAVSLLSVAGDATLLNEPTRTGGLVSQLTSMTFNSSDTLAPFNVFPATLDVTALGGNVVIAGTLPIALWPSPTGNLNLLAGLSVEFSGAGAALLMSDVAPSTLPNPDAPVRTLASNAAWGGLFQAPPAGVSSVPIHSADPQPARIVALTGNISNADLIFVPKPIQIVAGGDITGLYLQDQNLSSSDLSIISAGGSIDYPATRDPVSGALLSDNNHGVILEGPGSLAVSAGGNINLGTSLGITTTGNLLNPALPSTGASVSVLAGATPARADLTDFTNQYLVSDSTYDTQLIAYVSEQSNEPVTTKAQALQLLLALSVDKQFQFLEQVMFDEIRAGGEAAAGPGALHDNYTRSFSALASLFPQSTSSAAATGAAATYPGNISMYFSRIYTLEGGNISLLAPGGSINVGIATPPAAFGVVKSPDELGLVAQGAGDLTSVSFGDFEVNQSRVFAADGGNILVWSTDGNIDAGRGAKTAISAPAPTITFSPTGQIETVFPAVLTGSGIQALATSSGVTPGNVDLFAPQGVVNANDAGIVAGNLTIGATAVLGRDNITVSGVSVGLPVDTAGLGAGLASSSAVATSATSAASLAAGASNSGAHNTAPLAESALNWLDVFVTGLGEENCKPDDNECLKRQKLR